MKILQSFALLAASVIVLQGMGSVAAEPDDSSGWLSAWNDLPREKRDAILEGAAYGIASLGEPFARDLQQTTGHDVNAVLGYVPTAYGLLRAALEATAQENAPSAEEVSHALAEATAALARFLLEHAPDAPGPSAPQQPRSACGGGGALYPATLLLCPVYLVVGLVLIAVFLPVALASAVVAAEIGQLDEEADRIGDDFQKEWHSRVTHTIDWAFDLDSDGLGNVAEFRWELVPVCVPNEWENCRDHESNRTVGTGGDGWPDGAEVRYWNNEGNDLLLDAMSVGTAFFDPDRHLNTDNDTLANVRDADSDNDGLLDGAEALLHGSYPEFPDSDCGTGATICTRVAETSFYDSSRQGTPGTGDGLADLPEREAWDALGAGKRSTDFDLDGIFNNLLDPDADGDGLLDGQEFLLGKGQVRPDLWDTDGDGVRDSAEVAWSEDTDLDGSVNANDPDSDNDGMPDGWESAHDLNMVNPSDAALDVDVDALANLGEYQHGTLPRDPDSEGDELLDGPEVEAGTDPFRWDSDSDTLPDAWEVRHAMAGANVAADPLVADASVDGDSDSFTAPWCGNAGRAFSNRAEYLHAIPAGWDSRPPEQGGGGVHWGGTAANLADTDGDGLTDGYEVCSGLDPKTADVLGTDDSDGDGLSNAAENAAGTRHDDADSDGDGLCDGGRGDACVGAVAMWPGEGDYATDPLDADSDGEGWLDGPEAAYWDQAGTGKVPDSDRDGVSNLHEPDSDGDGLSDHEEHQVTGSSAPDPGAADGDADGLTDKQELDGWYVCLEGTVYGCTFVASSPRSPDTDNDGLGDAGERLRRTDPRKGDTDGDTLTDLQEVQGWAVVVAGQARQVTSDPAFKDTDREGARDNVELTLGTDPRMPDTDVDGLNDRVEDEDRDGLTEEGETSPVDADSDDDRLLDGPEQLSHQTDPLAADSDEDGLSDFEEVSTYHTSPLAEDTDSDFLPDGEEVGAPHAGGSPSRITNPTNSDTDADGLKDGEETYFYGTNPRVADSDCDGQVDGIDPNPYKPNVPPGWGRPAQDRLCAGAPTGSAALGASELTGSPSLSALSASTETEDNGDVGLLVFDEDGLVTVLARAPESEAPITVVHALVKLTGKVRVDAAGTLADESAHVSAELQPIDEPGMETTGNPYTHAVRVPLPEGMVEATAGTYALTFMDQNLNSATYTGEVSGFQLDEVEYQEDLNAADGQDWQDPSNATADGSGWDYARSNVTGGDPDPSTPPTDAAQSSLALGGLVPAAPEPGRVWIFRIVQPETPTLVGSLVDGVLVMVAPDNVTVPVRSVLFTDTAVPVAPADQVDYTSAKWWKPLVKAVKKAVQATSKAWSAGVQVATTVATVYNKVGQEVKRSTQVFYDEVKAPRSPAAHAARFALDMCGVGDVISIVEGVRAGDWTQVAFGVAGLALTVTPMIKGPVLAAKGAFAVAKVAGASDELFMLLGRSLEDSARVADAASIAKIERTADVLNVAAGKGKGHLEGLGVLAKVQGVGPIETQKVVQTTLHADFLGKQVATKTQAGAEEMAQAFSPSSQVPLDLAAKVATKTNKHAPDQPLFLSKLEQHVDANTGGIGGVASSALHMAPKQGKGAAYLIVKAADNIGMEGHTLSVSRAISGGKVVRPDEFFKREGEDIYREYKNYDDVFSLNSFNKQQLKNYGETLDIYDGKVEYMIKSGKASKGVKDLVKTLNDGLNAKHGTNDKVWLELLDDLGQPIL